MAGNRRPPPLGAKPGAPGSARNSFFEEDDERTMIDPEIPPSLQHRWEEATAMEKADNLRRPPGPPPQGKRAVTGDYADHSQIETAEEYTLEESGRGHGRVRAAGVGKLVIAAGNDRGKSFDLPGQRATLGRGVDNDIILSDLAVSRHHLILGFDGQSYSISDLGSGNGTLVNDEEYEGEYRLYDGDVLEIGNTIVHVELPNQNARGPELGTEADEDSLLPAGRLEDDDLSTLGGQRLVGIAAPSPAQALAAVRNQRPRPAGLPGAPPGARLPGNSLHGKPTAPVHSQRPSKRLPTNDFVSSPPSTLDGVPGIPGASANQAQPQSWDDNADRLPATAQPQHLRQGQQIRKTTAPVVYGQDSNQVMGTEPVRRLPGAGFAAKAKAGFVRDPRKVALAAGVVIALVALVAVVFAVSGGDGTANDDGEGSGQKEGVAVATNDPEDSIGESAGKGETPAEPSKPAKKADEEKVTAPPNPLAPLPSKVWGTDETRLLAELNVPTQKELEDPKNDLPEGDEITDANPDTVEPKDEPAVAVTEPEKPSRREIRKREAKKREIRKREAKKREIKKRERPKRVVRERPTRVKDPDPPVRAPKSASAARSKAAGLYKAKKFSQAAALLKSAAGSAKSREASKLRKLASAYASVGSNLSKGTSGDPVSRTSALNKALSADRSAGKAHQSLIRSRLKIYAPKAAATKMARKDYRGAKQMADIASRSGAGSKVQSVRSRLEKTAGQIYSTAAKSAKKGDKSKARKLLKSIRGMVPKSSSWYKKAGVALGKLK